MNEHAVPQASSQPAELALCPFHNDRSAAQIDRSTAKTMVLTGASRGIGHATVKLFSAAGWRIITCSRQPFDPSLCPWDAGADDHVQVDLADQRDLGMSLRPEQPRP